MARYSINEAHHLNGRILRKRMLAAELQSVTAVSSDTATSIQDSRRLFWKDYFPGLQIHIGLGIGRGARKQTGRQLSLAGRIDREADPRKNARAARAFGKPVELEAINHQDRSGYLPCIRC